MNSLVLLVFVVFANAQLDVLQTIYGPVKGVVANGIRYFKGVPFAAAPIGKLRFRPPQPPAKWTTLRDATTEGNICPQGRSLGPLFIGDEDCLYLDVYIPANAAGPLPVMIWIYGGAYIIGDKYEFGFYEATNMVNAGSHIHVAMNYRLGPFGFMSLPELFAESNTTGNYALQDQTFAFKWVHDNAAALGADLTKVTIFGESAGAISICWHLVSPVSGKYFTRAIMESGNCASGRLLFHNRTCADSYSRHYANSLGCAGASIVDCLRQLDTADLFGGDDYGPCSLLSPLLPWTPVIDHAKNGLSGVPSDLISQGSFNRVPTVIGTTNNEGDIFIPALPLVVPGVFFPLDQTTFQMAVMHMWNNATLAAMLETFYDHELTYEDILSAALRDFFFACPSRLTAAALSKFVPTFLYHWSFVADNWIDQRFLGDLHTAEIQFVYGNAWPPVVHTFDARDLQMVQATQQYWLSMAEYGNPNQLSSFTWPSYNTTIRANMRLDQPLFVEKDYRADICDSLWNNFPF